MAKKQRGHDISHHIGVNPDSNPSDVPMMKPYQTPVNINVSYITKNAITDSNFAKDDIVSNNKVDGIKPPDETHHIFHTDHPDPNYGIDHLNKKLSIDNPNHNSYYPPNANCSDGNCEKNHHSSNHYSSNHHSSNHDSSNHHSSNHDSSNHHSSHHHSSKHHSSNKTKNNNINTTNKDPQSMHSGNGFSYVKLPYQNNNETLEDQIESCPTSNSNQVCPIQLNQNWSAWPSQYLSGDDIKS